jgi:hypothetical protein
VTPIFRWRVYGAREPRQGSAAGPVGRFDSYRLGNLKQLLNGNIECSRKGNCYFCKKPRLAILIIGNHTAILYAPAALTSITPSAASAGEQITINGQSSYGDAPWLLSLGSSSDS